MNIFAIIKIILGLKFGWLLLIAMAIILGGSLIRNIFTGSFNVAKFAGGFNVLSGGVQGKLIYYGLIIFGCFIVYNFIMRPTTSFDTDYKNNIRDNRDVYLDQRAGETCSEKCIIAIQPLGFTLLKVGCIKSCQTSITQQTKVDSVPVITTTPIVSQSIKKVSIFRKIWKVVITPINTIKKVAGIK